MAIPGAILPAWRYNIQPDFIVIGAYFLSQGIGLLTGLFLSYRLIPRRGIRFAVILGSLLGCLALLYLALVSPPAAFGWRITGLFFLGAAAGFLNAGAFHAIAPSFALSTVATINIGGVLWGLGCFLSAMLVAGTFFVYTVPSILILVALIPGYAALYYTRRTLPTVEDRPQMTWSDVWRQFQNSSAVLLSLFLFVQLANEFTLAGWLPLFLSLRLGISPGTAVFILAIYWFALMIGRLVGQWLLPRFSHRYLLFGSVLSPLLGCAILVFTNNLFGAVTGALLAGGGFSVTYPLVGEQIGARFPGFHPGLFNGIFTLATTFALLAPASLGLLANFYGIGIVMGLPLAGTIVVLLLLLLITFDTRVTGAGQA